MRAAGKISPAWLDDKTIVHYCRILGKGPQFKSLYQEADRRSQKWTPEAEAVHAESVRRSRIGTGTIVAVSTFPS